MNSRVVSGMKSVQPRPFDECSYNETPPPELEMAEDGWSMKQYIKHKHPHRISANRPSRNSLRTAPELFVWDTSLKLQENSRYATLPNSLDSTGPNFSHVFSALDYYQQVTPGPSQSNKFVATFPPKRTQKLSPIPKLMVLGDFRGLPDIPYCPPSPPRHYTAPVRNTASPSPPPPSRLLPNREYTPVYASVGVIKPLYPMAVRANTSWVKRYQLKLKTSSHLTQARLESSLDQ